jgi:hypothetical protein
MDSEVPTRQAVMYCIPFNSGIAPAQAKSRGLPGASMSRMQERLCCIRIFNNNLFVDFCLDFITINRYYITGRGFSQFHPLHRDRVCGRGLLQFYGFQPFPQATLKPEYLKKINLKSGCLWVTG